MKNRKFKVGDRVRIINCSGIEPYELNEIGVVIEVGDDTYGHYIVDMGRLRRPQCDEDNETCWYLSERAIELAIRPNQQLLFDFMYQK